jgi:hypothetical protein
LSDFSFCESKPIIRWNIGLVSHIGYDCLQQAYRNLCATYDDRVEYTVTLNNPIRTSIIGEMEADGVKIFRVTDTHFDLGAFGENGRAAGEQKSGWVFAPFQLDTSRRQLILDNDILFKQEVPEITRFLFGPDETFLFKEHWPYLDDWPDKSEKRREQLRRSSYFRQMAKVLPKDITPIESSVVGIPSGEQLLTLRAALEGYDVREYMRGAKGWEQAFLALLYESVRERAALISYKVIPVYPRLGFQVWPETCGIHLSGINQLLFGWTLMHYKEVKRKWEVNETY